MLVTADPAMEPPRETGPCADRSPYPLVYPADWLGTKLGGVAVTFCPYMEQSNASLELLDGIPPVGVNDDPG